MDRGLPILGTRHIDRVPSRCARTWSTERLRTWGNSAAYQRVYDQDGRIQSVTIAGKARSYGFDAASRITSLADVQGTTSTPTAIAYDNLDRLTTAQGNVPGGNDLGYAYDLVGNRTSATMTLVSSTSTGPQVRAYSYDAASNRLTALSDPAVAYSYDAVGNTTGDGTFTYAYSGRNRLVTVSQGGSAIATYQYNALGQRVAKVVGSAMKLFAYDEAGHLVGEYDATGVPIAETVWLNDTPVATLRKSGTATAIHYVWVDHLDTPRAITTSDAAMMIEWSWDSDPFGSTAANEVALSYNLRFPGQYYDAETGKNYNYFRDYDPSIGRYIESDPIGLRGGLNTYSYVTANPLSLFDAQGLVGGTTESCEWYARRCAESGGKSYYYCRAAPLACKYTPPSPWTRCVRQCLQDFDRACSRNPDGSPSMDCVMTAHAHCWTKCPSNSCPSTK